MTSAEVIWDRLFSGVSLNIREIYSLLSHQEHEDVSNSFLARYNGTDYGRPAILLPPPEPLIRGDFDLPVWML